MFSVCCLIVLCICVKLRENLKWYQSKGADTSDGSADIWTDTQNFGGYNIIPLSLLWQSIKIPKSNKPKQKPKTAKKQTNKRTMMVLYRSPEQRDLHTLC